MRTQIYPLWLYIPTLMGAMFVVFSSGCTRQIEQPTPLPPVIIVPDSTAKTLKYLALGDSYTIGQGVLPAERFPDQTANILKALGRQLKPVEYIATTGWTTGNLLHALANANKPTDYDLVSLLIGVNNQYQGRSMDEYREQFTQCLTQAIQLAGGHKNRVFVISIPDYGATPFGRSLDPARIAREIDAFNVINASITASFNVDYTNITPGSRDAVSDPTLVASDGLHPSAKEYKKWAEALAPKMLKVLQ